MPLEDIGDPDGYAEVLEAISDTAHPRHATLTGLASGGFNPTWRIRLPS